jgi:hypothetical protein
VVREVAAVNVGMHRSNPGRRLRASGKVPDS